MAALLIGTATVTFTPCERAQAQSIDILQCSSGATVTYDGNGPASSSVSVALTSSIATTVTGGQYSLSLNGLHVPAPPNSFSISVTPVKTLSISGDLHVNPLPSLITVTGTVNGNTGTYARSDIPSEYYDITVFGDAADGASEVTITVTASTTVSTNSAGDYSVSLDTTGLPSGLYYIKQDGVTVGRLYIDIAAPATYTLNLVAGWNLVSIPLTPEDGQISTLFTADQRSDIAVIWDYVGGNDWLYWTTEPGYSNQFTSLSPENGYYFYCYEPMSVQIIGTPGSGPIPWGSLSSGWNMIGYPSTSSSAISSLYGDAAVVWKLENNDQWRYWTTEPNYINEFETLTPGLGYWVYKY